MFLRCSLICHVHVFDVLFVADALLHRGFAGEFGTLGGGDLRGGGFEGLFKVAEGVEEEVGEVGEEVEGAGEVRYFGGDVVEVFD